MKILFVSEPIYPLSGTASRTINFAKALSALGNDVSIITPTVPKMNYELKDVCVNYLDIGMPQSYGSKRTCNFIKFILSGGLRELKITINESNANIL